MRTRLSDERTRCPHCGLETSTSSDGMCVECWGDKRRDGRPTFFIRKSQGSPDEPWLGDAVWWAFGVVAAALAGLIVYLVTT